MLVSLIDLAGGDLETISHARNSMGVVRVDQARFLLGI